MIKVKVKYFNNNIEIEFPIDESNLLSQFQALSKNEIEKQLVASKRIKCLINEVIEPKDLSAIKDSVVNLDELNYLAKRMDSFVDKEFKQFYAAANCFGINKMKELINLTFNLQHYTLIQDFSSKENIGKTHLLNKLGGMSEEEMEKTDFASVGRELINSGTGKITEYGLLFENIDVPLEDVYDGQVFPLYVYKDCVAIVGIKFKEKTEYAYLPCDDIEFDNAVKRLGAYTLDLCEIGLAEINITDKRCCDCFKEVFMNEDIYSVNLLAAALDGVNNYEKLSAAIEFADANDSKSLSTIAQELDSFIYLPEVSDHEDLARHWIEVNKYELEYDLEDYFLFDQYGEEVESETQGMFISGGGYIYIENNQTLQDILDTNEGESIVRGVM